MRFALRLLGLAVALAAAGGAAAGSGPRLASLDATAPVVGGNDYVAAATSCAALVDEIGARDSSDNRVIRELGPPGRRADARTIADCRSAAAQGDGAAAYALGIIYHKGLGVPQDPAEAAKWLRKSADLGLAQAETSLGNLYALGEGVPQSRAEAMKWTRAAADQGDARAQYVLGLMYCDGRGDPQDLVQAHIWLNLAAAQGLRQAGAARDRVAAWIGSPAEIAKAQQMAVKRSAGARLAEDDAPRR